ncbi:uncharacterized protein N7483_000586 [Penicillium malachiteum]|uniref:uncharacterized protein n=1 Tax=Penicillium malachiteum TaxID=1324776 RepID=UPI00254837D6|nr:uncharacterized protein N7483_000586 [Penicillium malachiteum]KAJ5735461.1 hypothetical protein N7483_000586 [Penicillium malachiteum]
MDVTSSLVFHALSTPSEEAALTATNIQASDQMEASSVEPAVTEPAMSTTSTSRTPQVSKRKKAENAPKQTRRKRNEPEPEWSELVRKKQHQDQARSTRCRQACDRCKMRKARCDLGGDQADGSCLGCWVDGIPCKVTDRVTNETFIRGEAGQLRRELAAAQEELVQTSQRLETALENNRYLQEENTALMLEIHRMNHPGAASEVHHHGFTRASFPNPSLGESPFNNPE